MGAAESNSTPFRWVDKYELIDIDDNDHLLKIMSRAGQSQYLGKQITCYSEEKIGKMEAMIDKKILQPCPYLMKLVKVGLKKERQNCEQGKIFCMVFEKPYKTLKEDSIFRKLNKDPYNADDILCIMESVVRALCYLRQMGQNHTKISASNIYISEDMTVLLGDPWLLNQQNDFNETMHGNIYPSPEKILYKNGYINEPDLFLSDLFSLGITLLQMYFLEHMDTVYEKGYRRLIETKLIEIISNIKSEELRKKMKIILSHQPQQRNKILKQYSLVNSWAQTFINSQKQMFKKQYIKSLLVTSQVKTVKMSRRQYSDRDRKIHTERQQSDSDDTISGNKNMRLKNPSYDQRGQIASYIQNNQHIVHSPQPLRRQYYAMPPTLPVQYKYTPQKINETIPRRQSDPKTLFTFNKKSQQFQQNQDSRSISSIAKQESSFSKDFHTEFFENNGRYPNQIKMKNQKKSQFSKKNEGIVDTAAVIMRMNQEKNMKSKNGQKIMQRKSEPF